MLILNNYYSSLTDVIVGNDWGIPSSAVEAMANTEYFGADKAKQRKSKRKVVIRIISARKATKNEERI